MTVLFGHPTGNPNSHHAALAHYEAGRLEAFCIPWMPSRAALDLLGGISPLTSKAQRLARRRFEPLEHAPKVQGVMGEWARLARRALGQGGEDLSYAANDWLMATMAREVSARPAVSAVHSYEDCSLLQFREAKRRGKACLYDMPIGYYPAWEQTQAELARRYADWLPSGGLPSSRYVRPDQKRAEMDLADLVLAPSSFVERTIRRFHTDKAVALSPYGVDCEYWTPPVRRESSGALRFIYAGQLSLRKGIPMLLEAWKSAAPADAELELVGMWQLSESKRQNLPLGITLLPPCSTEALRERYRNADVFVFPSFFEGFGLVLVEAMACGLPVVATDATAGPDVVGDSAGKLIAAGDAEALIAALHWFASHRGDLPAMGESARHQATRLTWPTYRRRVTDATAAYV